MKQLTLTARKRAELGRGNARRIRKGGEIPGVIYGESGSLPLSFGTKELRSALHQMAGSAALISLTINGEDGVRSAILVESQKNPLTDEILHVDFHEISMKRKMTAHIPVRLEGIDECIGVREESGVFEFHTHEITVRCLPQNLPSEYALDVTNLHVKHAIHIKDLQPIEGVEFVDALDLVIAACSEMKAAKNSAGTGEAAESATAEPAPAPAGGGKKESDKK
ncbi:MAG: 50S ribosomal protein L25 [Puniceicoccales bacterium]|jgi:large subunit ribosomal protein L25|nr:50S ribosomal protein L25 [Puniceicoccales bacterium]